jgi:hypothetical protein
LSTEWLSPVKWRIQALDELSVLAKRDPKTIDFNSDEVSDLSFRSIGWAAIASGCEVLTHGIVHIVVLGL